MKRNRTQALDHVLEHRKKVIKGLGALIQILEAFPEGISGTDLLAARKARNKAAKVKAKPRAKTKPGIKPGASQGGPKKIRRQRARRKAPARRAGGAALAQSAEIAASSRDQPQGEAPVL